MADKRMMEKWAVYALTIVTFACAVWVTNRTLALVLCYGVLVAVAVVQSVRRSRAKRKTKK